MTVRVLKTILGAVMMLVAAIGVFLIIGYAVTNFGDLGRRVSDGNGYEAVLSTVVVFGMLGVFGYFLIDWGALRAAGTSTAATRREALAEEAATRASALQATGVPVSPQLVNPTGKRVGVVLAIIATVFALAVVASVGFQLISLLLSLIVPQIVLVVLVVVMMRSAPLNGRRPYRFALIITAIVNVATFLAVTSLIGLLIETL